MNDKKESLGPGRKKGSRKVRLLKWFLIIGAASVLLLFFAVPLLLSSEGGRKFIINRINNSIDGKVEMSGFSMGWFKGLNLKDFRFADTAGTTSVTVKEISARPSYGSLLFGDIAVEDTLIDQPQVVINIKEPAKALDKAKPSEKKAAGKAAPGFRLKKAGLTVRDGNVKVNTESPAREIRSVELKDIQSQLNLNPLGKESTFNLSLGIADGQVSSKISAEGKVTPAAKKGWTLKGTSGDVVIKIDNFDLGTLGPLFAIVGKEVDAAGSLNADITAGMDNGRVEKVAATAVLSGFKRKIGDKEILLDEPVTIDARISSDAETVRIDKLAIESSFCTLECKGKVNEVDYIAKADLAAFQDFAGQFVDTGGYSFAGKVTETGRISFDKDTIGAKGKAVFEGFVITKDKVATPGTPMEIDFDMAADTAAEVLKIALFKVAAGPGEITVTDSVVGYAKQNAAELDLRLKADIDLKKAEPYAHLFELVEKETRISGTFVSELSVRKQKTAYHVVTENTNVKKLVIAPKERDAFKQDEVKLTADVVCDTKEKTVAIDTLDLVGIDGKSLIKVTKGNVSRSSKGGKTKINGEFEAEYDLATVTAMASKYLPAGLTMTGKRKGTVKFESEYPEKVEGGLVANLNTKAQFGFDSAEYMGLNTNLAVVNGKLTVEPFSTVLNQGKINFACNADFNTQPSLLQTPEPMLILDRIKVTERMTNKLLMYLNPLFAKQAGISGIANFHCQKLEIPVMGGGPKDIEMAATVWIDDLKMRALGLPAQIFDNQGDFAVERTYFTLHDGLLKYDDLQLNVGNNPINFGGVIDIENKTYDLKIALPYTSDGRTVRLGQQAANRIVIRTRGNVAEGLDWDKLFEGILESLIEGKLKDLLGEKAEEILGDEGRRLFDELFK